MEAFRKIIKKHDKLTGWQTQDVYMHALRELQVFHVQEVRELRKATEDLYLNIEDVLCQLEPQRWQRGGGGGMAGGGGRSRGGGGGGGGGGGAAPGFYEVRRRRNQLLGKLRKVGAYTRPLLSST